MRIGNILWLLLLLGCFAACTKTNISKIPHISLSNFGPDSIRQNLDTALIIFSLTDGDADLGNDPAANPPKYDIFLKDMRFDTGYVGYYFPDISKDAENPDKGLTGTCSFLVTAQVASLRTDSLHLTTGDTTTFELYIKDRAGNESNHITTPRLIIRP